MHHERIKICLGINNQIFKGGEQNKLCCNFPKNAGLWLQNRNNFKKDFCFITLFFFIYNNNKGEEETKRKDRLFLPNCHSWKQGSVCFSFVLSNPRGAMQAGVSLCLFICREIAHKGKASLSRAETFVFPFFYSLLSWALKKKICPLCFSCVVSTVTCVFLLCISHFPCFTMLAS